MIASVALGPKNVAWIVDDRNNIYFSDDFISENPHWWQVSKLNRCKLFCFIFNFQFTPFQVLISEYIFQHSPSVFQNMHSKIRLNNLRANIQLKNTIVTTDERSVWIFDKFSTVVHVNKTDFTGKSYPRFSFAPLYFFYRKLNAFRILAGYLWSSLPLTLTSLKWEKLCGEGIFEDKGHLWFLSSNGDIFCVKPSGRYFQVSLE